jgi:outer membrane protein assembly factor BamB
MGLVVQMNSLFSHSPKPMRFRFSPRVLRWMLFGLLAGYVVYCIAATEIPLQTIRGNFPLKPIWVYKSDAEVVGVSISPTGIVGIRTQQSLIGIDEKTGALHWQVPVGSTGWPRPAEFFDGVVYVANAKSVWALNEATGQELWHTDFDFPRLSDARVIVVSACCVFVNRISDSLIAYDRISGASKWSVASGRGYLSAQVDNHKVYVLINGVQVLDENTGQLLLSIGGSSAQDSDYADGVLYYADYPFDIVAFDPQQETALWVTSLANSVPPTLQIIKIGEQVLVVAGNNLYALTAYGGLLRWQKAVRGDTAAMMEDWIFLSNSVRGQVTVLNVNSGDILGSLNLGMPGVARMFDEDADLLDVHNGILVVAFGRYVYAYNKR